MTTQQNRITDLFGIQYPIIQGGMVWCSGWRLASAVSNAGGLGLLGAGSMHPDKLLEHIHKMQDATERPWGINVPLMYPQIEELMDIIIHEGVKIVFTSAGSPKKYTSRLHEAGIKVAHVVSSSKFARKCEEAGVDAVVAEGFEAGGHNGREESTTITLLPLVRRATTLPLIAAGGIGSGQAMLAARALGAEGVQIGTLFAVSKESSAADSFKRKCLLLEEGDTMLALKKLSPTRLVRNDLYARIVEAEDRGASAEELHELLGKAASKRGIFEGDIENGELEIGQIVTSIQKIDSVTDIMSRLIREYDVARQQIIDNV
ncbi:oxidoreductase, 2-nitropropane dioxygenase family protein [Prevotella sp. DNF00663]|uniref:NAD(P)H-dependent flavin oxidoreductase n=1 Tax=unclassified Prevotella TaxID=2638335 RepID=UPI0005133BCA|nr:MULTISPECIES: nitronate monooxygenase [unclassified Prevotella]KGI60752.1 2-nitropropane dioxygenase [Prevotella sp. S7 MS 2]KXB78650.1 oxidoreductase, 2-nitropropane dioxygenase family protein [Prevotella sp. DNF00663]